MQTFLVTVAVVAPAIVICLNSLMAANDRKRAMRDGQYWVFNEIEIDVSSNARSREVKSFESPFQPLD